METAKVEKHTFRNLFVTASVVLMSIGFLFICVAHYSVYQQSHRIKFIQNSTLEN